MEEPKQRTIEYFFEQHGVSDQDKKAKLLPLLTDVIYEYNMGIVKFEKEEDPYRQKQIAEEVKEVYDKIEEIFQEVK